jgi:hypothetical protein
MVCSAVNLAIAKIRRSEGERCPELKITRPLTLKRTLVEKIYGRRVPMIQVAISVQR